MPSFWILNFESKPLSSYRDFVVNIKSVNSGKSSEIKLGQSAPKCPAPPAPLPKDLWFRSWLGRRMRGDSFHRCEPWANNRSSPRNQSPSPASQKRKRPETKSGEGWGEVGTGSYSTQIIGIEYWRLKIEYCQVISTTNTLPTSVSSFWILNSEFWILNQNPFIWCVRLSSAKRIHHIWVICATLWQICANCTLDVLDNLHLS